MTPRKFLRQPESVRRRHAPRMLAGLERRLQSGSVVTAGEIVALARLLAGEEWIDDACREALGFLEEAAPTVERGTSPSDLIRRVNHARHAILRAGGREPAEWDLTERRGVSPDREALATFPIALFGESIRSPYNVGSMIRSAAAFGAGECIFSPDSAAPEHPRARRSAMGGERSITVRRAMLHEIGSGEVPLFAVESGGVPVSEFAFPEQGIALFGNEELGLSHDALGFATASRGIVTVPLYGAKGSLNVAAAAAVILSWWIARLVHAGER